MKVNYAQQAKVFKAVCDEKRLYIIDLLRQGERCACQLLEDLDISQPSLSYHMKILVESGIVQSRQAGKWTHYSVSQEGSSLAVELLKEITKTEDSAETSCSYQVS